MTGPRVVCLPPPRLPAFDSPGGPWCQCELRPAQLGHFSAHQRTGRREMHGRKGVGFDQCGDAAAYQVDGVPLCARHAGEAALKLLLDH